MADHVADYTTLLDRLEVLDAEIRDVFFDISEYPEMYKSISHYLAAIQDDFIAAIQYTRMRATEEWKARHRGTAHKIL